MCNLGQSESWRINHWISQDQVVDDTGDNC